MRLGTAVSAALLGCGLLIVGPGAGSALADPTPQVITFTSTAPAATVGGDTYTPTATGGDSGNPVTFSISSGSSSQCVISSGTVSFMTHGSCVILADQEGNAGYEDAAEAQQTVTIGKAAQVIHFTTTAPAATVNGPTYTVAATGGGGNASVSFTRDAVSVGICTVDSMFDEVSFTGLGSCVIDAKKYGDDDYEDSAQIQQTVVVGKLPQVITFTSTAPTAATVGGPTYTPTATGGGSSNAVTFSIDGGSSSTCAFSSGAVSFTGVGACTIVAGQAGDSDYEAGSQTQTVTVGKTPQVITFTSTAPAATVGGDGYTPVATGGGSSNAVTFTIDNGSTGGCTVDGSGVVSFTAVGSCLIDADEAGTGTYDDAVQVQQAVTVGKGAQVITFTSTAPAATVGGDGYTPTATGGGSSNAVTFSIDGGSSSTCAFSSGTVSFTGVGACTIVASQAGDSDYEAGSQTQTVTVGKSPQDVITFTSTAPAATVGGDTYTPTVAGGNGSGSVSLSIDAASAGICTIGMGEVTFTALGACVIDAVKGADDNYEASAQVQQTVTVGKTPQVITFTSTSPAATAGGSYLAVASGGGSSNAVTLTIDNASTGGCTVDGSGVVSFSAVGSCVIDANQLGDSNYLAATQVQQTVTIGKGAQVVAFTSTAPAATSGGATYALTATGGGSANPVTFTFDNSSTGDCEISSGVVSFNFVGSCVIDANQAGDSNYNAATQVQQTVTISKGDQVVAFTSTAPAATVGGATYTPTATGRALSNPVVFSIDGGSTGGCAITSGHISFTTVGSCVVDANQAGSSNYFAATQVQQTVTIGKGNQVVAFTSTAPAATVGGATYTPAATGGASGNTVTFSIDGDSSGVCAISGGQISFSTVGTCEVDANQTGNSNYNDAPAVQQIVTMNKGAQVLAFTSSAPAAIVGGATYTPTATGGGSANPVTLTVDGVSTNCTINGSGVVSFTATGSCVIDADQAGNANYDAASRIQQTVTVASAPVVPVVPVVPTAPGAPSTPVAVAGTASVSVSWSAPSPSTGVTGYTVTGSPGSATCSTSSVGAASCVIGAIAGVSSTYTVVAHSPAGDSPASGASNAVTALAPPVPQAVPDQAPTTLTTPVGAVDTIVPSQAITVSGSGFAPFSTVTVVMYSAPIVLGTATTDASGSFSLLVTVPAGLEMGVHNFVAAGVDAVGSDHTMRMPVTLVADTSPVAAAPSTVKVSAGDKKVTLSFVAAVARAGVKITGYQASVDGGNHWATVRATGSPRLSATIAALVNDRTYLVQVRALTAAGAGTASASIKATPLAPWFRDPISAAGRKGEAAIPAHPSAYHGRLRTTKAAYRSHNGTLAVPASWAKGHHLAVNQAALLTGLFATDSAVITKAGKSQLKLLAASLVGDQSATCEGYSDFAGSSKHGHTLSLHRAQAVCAALRSYGAKVSTRSLAYGDARPVKIGGLHSQRLTNERVVLLVTK